MIQTVSSCKASERQHQNSPWEFVPRHNIGCNTKACWGVRECTYETDKLSLRDHMY